jgi:5-methyltetrahydropteroyltriglutamate--homocysteine methyltransferase
VSTKWPQVEEVDDLVRTMEAASAHLDLDQLAICPQCGFASAGEGNDDLDEDIQWRKLERMVEAARRIWPAA